MEEDRTVSEGYPKIDTADQLIVQSLAKLDGQALGIALGLLFGLAIFLATNILIFKGGDEIGPNRSLLGQFFIGYEVSFTGSIIGMIYGMIAGLIIGWSIAFIRNLMVTIYMNYLRIKGSVSAVNDYIDNP
jgi:tetrahydromethanopterin S-methyltransferase subunit G